MPNDPCGSLRKSKHTLIVKSLKTNYTVLIAYLSVHPHTHLHTLLPGTEDALGGVETGLALGSLSPNRPNVAGRNVLAQEVGAGPSFLLEMQAPAVRARLPFPSDKQFAGGSRPCLSVPSCLRLGIKPVPGGLCFPVPMVRL